MNAEGVGTNGATGNGEHETGTRQTRRILKVRLRQDQVIRLHELRILRGKSIAALLEGMIEEYLNRQETQASQKPPEPERVSH